MKGTSLYKARPLGIRAVAAENDGQSQKGNMEMSVSSVIIQSPFSLDNAALLPAGRPAPGGITPTDSSRVP